MLRCQEMLQQCRLGGFKPKDRPVTLERVDPRGMNEVENMTTQQQHEEKEVEKAFVLWDMGNCPIPDGHDPLTVVRKIQMAVEKSGHVSRNGEISITAIGSKLREIPGEDVMRILSSFEISFKHSHLYTYDLDEWADANPPPCTMMIIDEHERIGWMASQLSDLEDAGYRILLAYPPQRDLAATPFPRSFSKQWDWDALVFDDEHETTTTTTSLVFSQGKYNDEFPFACEVCFVAVKTFEDFTAHLKSVEHEYGEWDSYASKNGVDRTIRENLPLGRSKEMDVLLIEDMEWRLMKRKEHSHGLRSPQTRLDLF
ncbi:uncharacterized protein LOC130496984 [Raphanus sativus]|uniref:Uncharacterized protein LOC130496984 n=1 Tax=Raphanus sativus TaxID=3726 RepID=A0A9W3C2N5_RAPSA|nr:uncharacterized protein LOC130496984 [Raphanus sativus]